MPALQRKYAREYETIYIMNPAVDADEADRVANKMTEVIARLDGKLTKIDNWGKRKLAFPVQKNSRGVFVYLRYLGFNDLVAELERNLRMVDNVMRFQTIVLRDEIIKDDVAVNPDEVKFRRLETTPEEPEDTSLEAKLGLLVTQKAEAPRELEEGYADDDLVPVAGEAVEPAAEAKESE